MPSTVAAAALAAVLAAGVGGAVGLAGREPVTVPVIREPVAPPLAPTLPPQASTTTTTTTTAPAATTVAPTTTTVAPTTTRPRPPTTTRLPPPPHQPPPPPVQACPSTGFGGVKPHVARAGYHLAARFGIAPGTIGGLAPRSTANSDHPKGLALDFPTSRELGDQLAAYVIANRDELAVSYVIWRQRIDTGSGWEPMADRGGTTANHYDHVHVSFQPTGSGVELTC